MLRLFVLAPTVVFKARVNQASFTYPLAQVTYDGVTVGNYALLERNLTILFGTTDGSDDLGRQRIRKEATSTVIYFGRSSNGTNDGEVALANDAYITVLNDRRVWAKIPYDTEPPVTQYKDHDVQVGTYTSTPPPVANTGSPAAGTIDSVTEKLRVRLPQGSQTSYAVATGATIAGYVWTLPTGVTLAAGYALTDSFIEVDCDPGFYWIGMAVTDSNGKTHEAWTWILARDPDADVTIQGFNVRSHRRTAEGQSVEVEITQDLPSTSYLDGTLVALIDGEPAAANDRTNLLFWGWHQLDPAEIRANREGTAQRTRMACVDVAGRLATLPAFPQMVENDDVRDTGTYAAITWSHMVDFDLEKFVDYILRWHSTALELTDFWPTHATGTYAIGGALQSDGSSLWGQVTGRVRAFTPGKNIGCNKHGQLLIRHNPLLENTADRTATVQAVLTADEWSGMRWTYQHAPKVHWLRGSAVKAVDPLPTNADGPYQPVYFCIAPGFAPGQGETADVRGEMLADSQTRLNDAMGHEYARLNARESVFDIALVGSQHFEIDPAEMTWVTLTLPAAYAAQRGLSFTTARGLPVEIGFQYEARREGLVRSATLRWERETVGRPALTIVQPEIPKAGDSYVPVPWTPPLPDDPDTWYDPIRGYILWDAVHMMRTWDVLAASPTWELVDTGITGDIYSAEYVHVDATTVGVWLLTSAGVWWCANIMATTPSWDNVLSLAEMQAVVPTTGGEPSNPAVFKAMATYGSDASYCIVACGPDNVNTAVAYTYNHIPFMHTHDHGATWTYVDPVYDQEGGGDIFSEGTEPNVASYCGCGLYGLTMFRSSPTIFAFRSTPNLQDQSMIIYSEDGGHVWGAGWGPPEGLTTDGTSDFSLGAGFLRPYPSISDHVYIMRGNSLAGEQCHLMVGNGSALGIMDEPGAPAGYEGGEYGKRPNQRTGVPDHVIALWRHDSTNDTHILESEDAGATWTFLYDTNSPNGPINTPNGWPSDFNVWFIVRTTDATGSGSAFSISPIQFTDDKFGTVSDKQGNLYTLLSGTWVGPSGSRSIGFCDGFALPKVGVNA